MKYDKSAKIICAIVFVAALVVGAVVGSLSIHPATFAAVAAFTAGCVVLAMAIAIPMGVVGTRRRAASR